MPDKWEQTTLGDLTRAGRAELLNRSLRHGADASSYKSVGVPVVAVKNIGDNRLPGGDIPRVDEATRIACLDMP